MSAIDIDGEAIAWCEKHYDAERFRFHHSTHSSVSYHQSGKNTPYKVPEPDGTFDLVVSNSLLTHVLEGDLENYIRESYRLLRAGGAIMHSHFNLDYPPATYGTRHTFQHAIGNARVEFDGAAGGSSRLSHRLSVPGRKGRGLQGL